MVNLDPQLPPHPLPVPHSTHLGVEAVGFAEVMLATRIIAQERGELGAARGLQSVGSPLHLYHTVGSLSGAGLRPWL